MPYPTGYAILPATQALFKGKLKVTLEQAILEMGQYGDRTGTILIVEREDGNGKTTRFMLSSAGRMDLPVGSMHKAHHDQSGRPYGDIKILDVIFYEVKTGEDGKDKVVTQNHFPPLKLDSKFPLFVFK